MNKSTKISLLVAGVVVILIGIIGITFAFFSAGGVQSQANTFNSGCLNISLSDASASINLTNTYPITDVEGLKGTSYDFTITNTCSTDANYQINLESLNKQANSLNADYIKVSLSSDTNDNVISTLSSNTSVTPTLEGAYESYNLYTGTLSGNETKTYHLRLWIDYDATVEQAAQRLYQSKINVIANPETEVIDTLEAKFSINNATVTSTLSSNVTSATYCVTETNMCTPSTNATITNNSYTVELEEKTKEVVTALGNLTVNESTTEVICTTLNGTSKIICSNPNKINTPDFSKIAQASCEGIENCEETNGIYEAEDDYGTSYYYRGSVDNNWVYFADFYWRIIRINGDGSIRMIYAGTDSNVTTGTGTQISLDGSTATYQFNSNYNASYYSGLKYSASQHGTTTDSDIMKTLNTWYDINLIGYASYLTSGTGFCNDREMASGYTWSATPSSNIFYEAYVRIYNTRTPTLDCTNNSDNFTTNGTEIGNGALSNPIGLITADEVAMAGGKNTTNYGYYLYTGQHYWTMSPSWYFSGHAHIFAVNSDGYLSDNSVINTYGVRPIINLDTDVILTGSGTASNPYIVS